MIAIVHLVRATNGIEPFAAFLKSYRTHAAQAESRLVLVFKGFSDNTVPPDYAALCDDSMDEVFFVEDRGFDLDTYFKVAMEISADSFCFLNSFSEPLTSGWLALMQRHLKKPEVGMVGASGNWTSWYTTLLIDWEQLKTHAPYRGLLGGIRLRLRKAQCRMTFPPFPNPHLRTNAFLISRDLFLSLRHRPRPSRKEMFRFESGRTGITKQVMCQGLSVQVVGKDGQGYPPEEWPQSQTFWQGSQENLLVADNQTRHFDAADVLTRRRLMVAAWGDRALL